jgi:hypothetical protein
MSSILKKISRSLFFSLFCVSSLSIAFADDDGLKVMNSAPVLEAVRKHISQASAGKKNIKENVHVIGAGPVGLLGAISFIMGGMHPPHLLPFVIHTCERDLSKISVIKKIACFDNQRDDSR